MGYRGSNYQQQSLVPLTPVVKALIITSLCVWIFGQMLLDRFFLSGHFFSEYLALTPIQVFKNFYFWQFWTYSFLQNPSISSIFQVVLNLLALWWIGSELEQKWGSKFFFSYYMTCAVGAGLLYCLLIRLFGSELSLGAEVMGSTSAVFGLLLAYGILFGERVVLFFMMFPMKSKYMVMILGGIEFINLVNAAGSGGQEIAALAHLGGIIVGFLYLFFYTKMQQSRSNTKPKSQAKLKLVINNDKKKSEPKYWN